MSGTQRLYYDDAWRTRFQARVVAHAELHGRHSVVLDRTAFYPESGGQMADHGTLGEARVEEVVVDEADVVHHLVAGPLPEIGSEVEGVIDWQRRRLHMALHTGQHILSRALDDEAGAQTVSSRLGETNCTIDVNRPSVAETELDRVEALTNAVIDDALAIRAFFPSDAELAELPLRRAPKVAGAVRVVRIGEFDVTPCGGTHCSSSAEVGLLRITGVERYKGGTRISFAAGSRARRGLWGESEVLRGLGQGFTCAPTDVPAAVDKLRRQLTETRELLGQVRAELAERVATELGAERERTGQPLSVAQLPAAPAEMLRAVAARLVARPDAVALLAGTGPEGTAVVVQRGADSDFQCGAFLKRAAALAGGRGGGRPERAEGRMPADVDWTGLVARLLAEGAHDK